MAESNLLTLLRVAGGLTAFKKLPVPRIWDLNKRPHVAVLESAAGKVFSFFVSQPSSQNEDLNVSGVEDVPSGTIVEVRYNGNDYRYYRRDGQIWRMVAEARNHFFIDVYDYGEITVVIPFDDKHVMASD